MQPRTGISFPFEPVIFGYLVSVQDQRISHYATVAASFTFRAELSNLLLLVAVEKIDGEVLVLNITSR